MPSKEEICNFALAYIGSTSIISITDPDQEEARQCNRFFNIARDALLESFMWNFATKYLTLSSPADVEVSGWENVYSYPADCLVVRSIYNPLSETSLTAWRISNNIVTDLSTFPPSPLVYDIVVDTDLDAKYIVSDDDDAELIYTARVEVTSLYPALFVDALSWSLASRLAMPLVNNPSIQAMAINAFDKILNAATVSNANETEDAPDTKNPFVTARQ